MQLWRPKTLAAWKPHLKFLKNLAGRKGLEPLPSPSVAERSIH